MPGRVGRRYGGKHWGECEKLGDSAGRQEFGDGIRSAARHQLAGNITFGAPDFARPATLGQLQSVVARAARIRVLGTGHSFNDMADSPGTQVSLSALPAGLSPGTQVSLPAPPAGLSPGTQVSLPAPPAGLETDSAASVVRVPAGLTYAQLAAGLDARGLALRNLASLPHISVAGACATATHGSGPANQNLAAAVSALTLVTADGDLLELARGDDGFDGAVVHLGALGVVISLTLALVPSFDRRPAGLREPAPETPR